MGPLNWRRIVREITKEPFRGEDYERVALEASRLAITLLLAEGLLHLDRDELSTALRWVRPGRQPSPFPYV